LNACFVLSSKEDKQCVNGYYTLTNSRIKPEFIPWKIRRKLPRSLSSIPVSLLDRIAVDQKEQNQGWGSFLLIEALKRSFDASRTIGSFAVVVHPVDYNADLFYRQYGFIKLADSNKMFLVMSTVKQLFALVAKES